LFHITYNTLAIASPNWPRLAERWPSLEGLFAESAGGYVLFSWPVMAICLVVAVVPIVWLRRLPYQATREEQISDARARQTQQAAI
jgi:hypothetical protein